MSSSLFDSAFRTIPFYNTHDYMLPFVGNNYESPKHKKLLLVGESHYMPKGSTIHHNVDLWYNGIPELSCEEKRYCDTRGSRYYKSGSFGRNIDSAVREAFSNVGENAFNEMASYNYFLRPSDGGSFEELCKEKDCEESVKIFHKILEILEPELIVFTSKFAFEHAEWIDFPKYFGCGLWEYTTEHNMGYIFTEHPSCPWWNKVVKIKTGSSEDYFHGFTSKQFFIKYLKENWLI